jgi:hypothetical protein
MNSIEMWESRKSDIAEERKGDEKEQRNRGCEY